MLSPLPGLTALPQLTLPTAVAPQCRLCVTIPAKDEANYIPATLAALYKQLALDGTVLDRACYEVILFANNCTDATAAVARQFGRQHPDFRLHVIERTLPPEIANVGAARRMMMGAAARRLPTDGIICTTDADTLVDTQWVAATLRAFDRGARAVGGRIVVPATTRTAYRKIHLQDVTYRTLQAHLESIIDPSEEDPWPRHFQHYGPSTAVRVDAYLACGGMPAVRCIEDVELAWALERIDVQFVHDPSVKVYTSDRQSDRIAGVGFSHALDEWTNMLREDRRPRVGGLQRCIQLFKWKVALRKAFSTGCSSKELPALDSLLDFLGISRTVLERTIADAETFGALYQHIRRRVEGKHEFSDTTFDQAIRDLRRFTHSARAATPCASKHRVGSDRPAPASPGTSPGAAHGMPRAPHLP